MSVLHLLGSRGDGGAETYFVDLVRALHAAGMEQACAVRPHAERSRVLTAAGATVGSFGFGGPIDLLTRPRIAAFARQTGATALVAWMNRAARHAPAGPWKRIGRLGGYYSLKYYKGFDHLVGNTRDIADWVVSQGWPAGQVTACTTHSPFWHVWLSWHNRPPPHNSRQRGSSLESNPHSNPVPQTGLHTARSSSQPEKVTSAIADTAIAIRVEERRIKITGRVLDSTDGTPVVFARMRRPWQTA